MADAERLAIRRLLSRAVSDASIAPGPPLPRSHPAPALLAKLELNVHAQLESARALSKSHGNVLTSDLRRVLSDGRSEAAARAYKWLGVDAGEAGRVGEAVAWLQLAKKTVEEVSKPSPLKKARREVSIGGPSDELEAIQSFLKSYTRINDTVSFQPVPSSSTLLGRVPSGRAALSAKPYSPPDPSFGALEATLDAMRLEGDDASDSDDDAVKPSSRTYY